MSLETESSLYCGDSVVMSFNATYAGGPGLSGLLFPCVARCYSLKKLVERTDEGREQ